MSTVTGDHKAKGYKEGVSPAIWKKTPTTSPLGPGDPLNKTNPTTESVYTDWLVTGVSSNASTPTLDTRPKSHTQEISVDLFSSLEIRPSQLQMATKATVKSRQERRGVQFSARQDSQETVMDPSPTQIRGPPTDSHALVLRAKRLVSWLVLALRILRVLLAWFIALSLMYAIINIMIDTENQYQLTLVDQQIAITSAEKMYEMKACDSALWSWQPACSELAKTRAIVPGLGVTRTGTLIALIDEFHKIPESYVELFEQVAWKFLMMCSAPGLGRTLWSFSSSLGDGLGLFFGTYVFGFWSMVARVFG